MASASLIPGIQPNPDIAGVGVRTAFYAQAFLSILPLFIIGADGQITLEELRTIIEIVETNEVTACALVLSALIQAWTYGLTTYHADIVLF